jgi:homoserine O-acetyltransferase
MVERIVVNCGSARTARHNFVFLEGIKAALTTDRVWRDGWFAEHPVRGLRAFARIYAGWALSQAFYRERLYETIGYASLEDFLVHNWEASFLRRDANNLLAQIWTWQHADISANALYGGDLPRALSAIEAKVLLMPSETDLYFTVDDNRAELPHLRRGVLEPIPSIWGHRAGNPVANEADRRFIADAVARHLTR